MRADSADDLTDELITKESWAMVEHEHLATKAEVESVRSEVALREVEMHNRIT